MANPPRAVTSAAAPPPKNTRDNSVARYRYSVKSYHSTMVEKAATAIEARDTSGGNIVASVMVARPAKGPFAPIPAWWSWDANASLGASMDARADQKKRARGC